MTAPDDARQLAELLAGEMTPEQQQAFVDSVLAGRATALIDDALRVPGPELGDVPGRVRGFRVRLDLVGARPPVWRRLELPGDLALDGLHEVIQTAMGWFDGHLHRFRTGSDARSPYFLTPFDVEEGETGVLEREVRLDQLFAAKGDRLWYDYDFGDDWEHVLAVEAVLDEPPAEVRCTAGKMACPPEDCGGVWGYEELAAWVRGGCPASSVPEPFEDGEHALGWLPPDWHPDRFDLEETNAGLADVLAEQLPLADGLAALRDRLEVMGDRSISRLLAATSHTEAEVGEGDAARLVEPFVTLLDEIGGDGVRLTAAGYLPPAVVEQIAEGTGVSGWWIGKVNREDLTLPVAQLRSSARALGLVSVRKGRLAPTALARRLRDRPQDLLRHIADRLPLGRTDFDREAGWLSLTVAASGAPAEEWASEIRHLVLALGWRVESSGPLPRLFPVGNPTLDLLEQLSGEMRQGRGPTGVDAAVAATARSVVLG